MTLDLSKLLGRTVVRVETAADSGEPGDWAVVVLDGGLRLYVDEPTLYGDDVDQHVGGPGCVGCRLYDDGDGESGPHLAVDYSETCPVHGERCTGYVDDAGRLLHDGDTCPIHESKEASDG